MAEEHVQPAPRETHGLRLRRWAWTAAGALMVMLGIIGAMLPVMPTTIFLILALACFSRASPRLEHWLLQHPTLARRCASGASTAPSLGAARPWPAWAWPSALSPCAWATLPGGSSSWSAAWKLPSSSTCCVAQKVRKRQIPEQNLPAMAAATGSKFNHPRKKNSNCLNCAQLPAYARPC